MGSSGTFSTNGASLEDCHTNVFVLTELTGLSWKKFVTPSDQHIRGCTEVGEDPILRAYGQCLSKGLLCVWTRAPLHDRSAPATGPSQIDLRLPGKKELTVFWYSEEPEILKTLTSSLTNPEGKKSWDQGVEYETRTLLFKALHNLIERCLLTKGFVRLGKWFVNPLDSELPVAKETEASYIIAFSFTFFLHGEMNVCVCVNTQRQPPVYRVSRRHLTESNGQKVIIAPWSLKGVLNTASYQSSGDQLSLGKLPERQQQVANKQWQEWAKFYPLPEEDKTENLGDSSVKEVCGCQLNCGSGCGSGSRPPPPTGVPSKAALKFGASGALSQLRTWDKTKLTRSGPFHRRSPLTVLEDGRQTSAGGEPQGATPVPLTPTMTPGGSSVLPGGTPLVSPTVMPSGAMVPPMISLPLNLPPHEPVTQMISPAAPSAPSLPPSQQMEDTKPISKDLDTKVLGGFGNRNTAEIVETTIIRPSLSGLEKPVFSQKLKRPRLETLKSVVGELSVEAQERMDSSLLYKYGKVHQKAPKTISLWHDLKGDDLAQSQGGQEHKIQGLISLGDDHNINGLTVVKSENQQIFSCDETEDSKQLENLLRGAVEEIGGRCEPESSLQRPEDFLRTQTTDSLPDNIMDDQPIMSPPASNENEDQQSCSGQFTLRKHTVPSAISAVAAVVGLNAAGAGRSGGPPSVGEYSKIYPTPPSLEPTISHQFSPETPANLLSCCAGGGSYSGKEGSIGGSFSPSLSFGVVVDQQSKVVFDRPKLGKYLASSKFFGPVDLMRHRVKVENGVKAVLPEYKSASIGVTVSSSVLKLTTAAAPIQNGTPTGSVQAQGIFGAQFQARTNFGQGSSINYVTPVVKLADMREAEDLELKIIHYPVKLFIAGLN